ncbi:MAG TPA: sialidase family protein [Gaiellaceae bacterium]
MSSKLAAVAAVALCAFAVAGSAFGAGISTASTASPPGTTPQNHQNEPAVAIDANHPNIVVAGWNDFVDWAPCPRHDAVDFGTCADDADSGVGLSAVAFSFDNGNTWTQPTYPHGWTAADCNPTASSCTPHVGPIHTLPGYYENGLVSSGDPGVTVGPVPDAHGHFDWSNGERVYYANLVGAWPSGFAFPNPEFHGYLAVGVSRLDNPTPASIAQAASWQAPVIVNRTTGQTAFEDKEQIWADNASLSPFFGRVYLCNPEFRSNGQHRGLGGNFPAPLTVSFSADGGSTWSTKQITPAGTTGLGPTLWGISGCTVRTDSHGTVYVFAEMFENPTLVGLPTHGFHVMWTSTDGGAHWSKMQVIRQITDPCYFTDPVYGRCVMDGYAGARTDLSAAPSVDIANGAPSGLNASNEIVDVWADSGSSVNSNVALLSYSTNGGQTWSGPAPVSQPGDRPLYAAPALSPSGDRMYVVYEADTAPWRGADMASPRPYHGVFETAAVGAGGAPGAWTALTGPLGDLRATYPGHDIYQERVGDYVYAAASQLYGLGVWTDASAASVCPAVQNYRAASLAAGTRALPAPWPLADCAPTFGNTETLAATTG